MPIILALLLTSCAAIPKDVSVGLGDGPADELVINIYYNRPIGNDDDYTSRTVSHDIDNSYNYMENN